MAKFRTYTGKIGALKTAGELTFSYIRIDHDDNTETIIEKISTGVTCKSHIAVGDETVTIYVVEKTMGMTHMIYAIDIGGKRSESCEEVSKIRRGLMHSSLYLSIMALVFILAPVISIPFVDKPAWIFCIIGGIFALPSWTLFFMGVGATVSADKLRSSLPKEIEGASSTT